MCASWWTTRASGRAFGGEPVGLLARQRQAVVAELRGARAARWDTRLQRLMLGNRIALKSLARRPNSRERDQLAAVRAAAGARLGVRATAPPPASSSTPP